MLAPQTALACQIMISTTESLKKKATKYVLATSERQEPGTCLVGNKNQKSRSYIPFL